MAAQRAVDVGLVASSSAGVALEPGDDVRIQAEGDLLLDGAIQRAPLGCRPVEHLRYLGRVDLVVGQLLQSGNLLLLISGESVSALLHRQFFPVWSYAYNNVVTSGYVSTSELPTPSPWRSRNRMC